MEVVRVAVARGGCTRAVMDEVDTVSAVAFADGREVVVVGIDDLDVLGLFAGGCFEERALAM